MDFQLSEEHLMIQQAARDFAQQDCLPGVIERDEHNHWDSRRVYGLYQVNDYVSVGC